jgi:adenylate cyclase
MKSGHSIAVLPFVNMSSDSENEYFSDGITEEIINALARIDQLRVISRTSSFFFKGKSIPLKEIAEQLQASVILEGSVRFAGKNVRITAQLIQAASDAYFWSETWDRKMENIFEIQDEISLLIADKLREQFGHLEIGDHLVKAQTSNLDAYSCSLKARYYVNKWNPEDMHKAIALYEKALQFDPQHAESYVGLADVYGFMATTEFLPREESWEQARRFIDRALEIDPDNAGAYHQLAHYNFFVRFDYREAVKCNARALDLHPGYPDALGIMAFFYIVAEDFQEARKYLDRALGVDPLNMQTRFQEAYYQYRSGKVEAAEAILRGQLKRNPHNIPAYVLLSYCLLKTGQFPEAIRMMDEMPDEILIPDERLGILCLAAIREGKETEWQRMLPQLEKAAENPSGFQAHSYLFLCYANLRRHDDAFAWVEKARKLRSTVFLLSFTSPMLESLREDARYRKFHQLLYPPVKAGKAKPGKKAPLLDDGTAAEFTEKLLRFVKEETPFLNPELSLRLLADQVEIHPNQVSWILNEQVGKNFNEFINHFRVEHFKQLALDPSNSHISLIGLAFESGFNSKTVFNTFFKKEVGMTPSQFVKSHS